MKHVFDLMRTLVLIGSCVHIEKCWLRLANLNLGLPQGMYSKISLGPHGFFGLLDYLEF